MIDRQKLFSYGKEIIIIIIDIFFTEYDERFFRKLRKNVEEKDFVQLKENAHKLKGAIGNFWDPVTSNLSTKLLEMATDKTVSGLDQVYDDLEKNTLLLVEEMKILRQELTS